MSGDGRRKGFDAKVLMQRVCCDEFAAYQRDVKLQQQLCSLWFKQPAAYPKRQLT